MKPHQILDTIGEQLEGEALEYWNGADHATRNEVVIHAQREGLEAAVELVQDLVTAE